MSSCRRIVVKLGTTVITHDGIELALGRVHGIVEDIVALHKQGYEIIVVSSGAVGMGMRQLGIRERPRSLGIRQACAAVGQSHLMSLYNGAFGQLGVTAAQVLLTHDDLADRDRALCIRTTLMRLLELRTLPVLNENDSVSVRELVEFRRAEGANTVAPSFGDNDGLSARVALAVDADLLVLMTDVDGLFTANPNLDPTAVRIEELRGVDDDALARTRGTSTGGTGGMTSKLEAARLVSDAGIFAAIVPGHAPNVLRHVVAGGDVGTLVRPHEPRRSRERYIAAGAVRRGALIVNSGAVVALRDKKASLLPIGVTAVEGNFERGDVVEIRDPSGRVHGRGLVNYDAKACAALAGHHSSEIASILGYRGYDALVTRDNLALGDV